MRALVVGAGAVGQAYARHLQLGGAEVTFFVRDKYRATLERGLDMYWLNAPRPTEPVRFETFSIVTQPHEVAARRFDQVYLTVSSPALAGPWLRELIAATGDATIIALEPGADDRAVLLAAGVPVERLVQGMITLISYSAPLPGETRFPKPGMAYWFPPMAPAPHSGPRERTAAVVRALRAGKLPSKVHRDVPATVAFPSAVLMPYLIALESAGWSFRELGRGPAIALGASAAREALAITAATTGRRTPFGARAIARPTLLRLALWFGRRVIPLPLEIYLREHFTKVHAQTIEFMEGYIAKGKKAGVSVAALEELLASVEPAHAPARSERPVA
jgi:2-dehydropantoate 2-reductase